MNPLIEFVSAREALRKKKERGFLPPWTNDPILQQYRFCNVRRRDDRVSRWLRKNVLTEINLAVNTQSFIQFAAFCRWNNWPPTIDAILKRDLFPVTKIDWSAIVEIVEAKVCAKEKSWTGAYMIKAPENGETKTEFVAEICSSLSTIWPELQQAFRAKSRRDAWITITQLNNWGGFMTGQLVDDLSWTPLLSDAKDTFTWAPQGPGSLRGFNRLQGLPLKTKHSEEEWCSQLQGWRQEIIDALGKEYEDCTLHDTQNQLCELDKFLRAKNGEGRPRSKYRPETVYQI
jgi:hypothetical protein